MQNDGSIIIINESEVNCVTIMFRLQTFVVLLITGLSLAKDYNEEMKKLWSGSESVIDVTSASIVIKPSNFNDQNVKSNVRSSRMPYIYQKYSFRPRSIPLIREDQVEKNIYYEDKQNSSGTLFPGNYLPIEKRNATNTQYNIQEIPMIRNEEFQKRSFDEPIIEKPEDFSEATASRRSISYILGEDGDDDDFEDETGDYEEEDIGSIKDKESDRKKTKIKAKPKKLKKYMLPLLLAYKLKYFALVPVLISGLILLIGATGLAGFFFALFAAVMGLQKGSY